MHTLTMTGRMGIDPELRETKNGKKVCNFVCYSPEWGDEALRVDGSLWDKTAEFCAQYVKKGDWVAITGKIELNSWENKDGETQYSIRFKMVNDFSLCQNRDKTQDADEPKRDL